LHEKKLVGLPLLWLQTKPVKLSTVVDDELRSLVVAFDRLPAPFAYPLRSIKGERCAALNNAISTQFLATRTTSGSFAFRGLGSALCGQQTYLLHNELHWRLAVNVNGAGTKLKSDGKHFLAGERRTSDASEVDALDVVFEEPS